MALTPKRKMTEKSTEAHRRNGRKSRGATTREGKARAARANLIHGFYSEAEEVVLTALGEDAEEYRRLLKSLGSDLTGAMEGQLVGRIGRAFWRMRRAERMQDGLALQRIRSGTKWQRMMIAPEGVEVHETYEAICNLYRRINRPEPAPSAEEVESLIEAFGEEPPEELTPAFPLYRAYWKAVWKFLAAGEDGAPEAPSGVAAAAERDAAYEKFNAVAHPVSLKYARRQDAVMKQMDQIESPASVAAMMAPKDDKALLMQKKEDSNLRQLWRLTSLLMKVKNGSLSDTESVT